MGVTTGISWTDATWNPIRGCSRVSEGCRHCYAESVAYRFSGPGLPYEGLVQLDMHKSGMIVRVPKWNGKIKFVEGHLLDPLRWKKPRRIFVNSMSDLFHENVTDEMRDKIFAVMALCPQHTFQVLTKRPERQKEYLSKEDTACRVYEAMSKLYSKAKKPKFETPFPIESGRYMLPNVHLGVSVENQKAADERIPLLLQTPAAVRFISAEPLLGPVNLMNLPLGDTSPMGFQFVDAVRGWRSDRANKCGAGQQGSKIDWVIVGGESGPGARPMHPDWARSLRDQCKAAGVPFFFKQWGAWEKYLDRDAEDLDWRQDYTKGSDSFRILNLAGGCGFHGERVHVMQRVGTKASGCKLDGVEHHEFPDQQELS
jgi:protein gp37